MQLRSSGLLSRVALASILFAVGACGMSAEDSGEQPSANYTGGGSDASAHPSGGAGGSGRAGSAGSSMGGSGGASQGGASGAAGAMNADAAADAPVAQDSAPDALEDAPVEAEQPDVDLCAQLDQSQPLVLYQSADDSNSMASPAIARRLIKGNQRVPAPILRTYEFLNYYNIVYQAPQSGHVTVVPQMRPGTKEGEYILQVGLQAEKAAEPRRPMNITFVLDNTGSMSGSPLALERAAVRAISQSMKAGDIVSMLAWNTSQWVLLDNVEVSGPEDSKVSDAINKLTADGSTDLHAGLVKGYELAQKSYDKTRMNRVVLISDGVANVGVVSEDLIAQHSHAADGEGIYLVGVGVGDGINDTLMNVVTDRGRGAYVYLDSEEEANKIFGPRFDEVMEVAVRNIRLELSVPWYFTLKSTSAEQTSTNPKEVDPQYLAPNDAVVINNTFLPCGASQWNEADVIRAKATYNVPLTNAAGEDEVTTTLGELLQGNAEQLEKGTAIVAYAETLKRVATLSGSAGASEIDSTVKLIKGVDPDGADADLQEIISLLETYKKQF